MKPPAFKYIAANTVDKALSVLSSQGDRAKILAGGQSLTPMLNFRLAHPEMLVDINPIKRSSASRRLAADCKLDV